MTISELIDHLKELNLFDSVKNHVVINGRINVGYTQKQLSAPVASWNIVNSSLIIKTSGV